MQTLQRTSLLIVVVLLAVTACVIPNVTITDPVAQATILAVTIDASIRGTQAAQPAGHARRAAAATARRFGDRLPRHRRRPSPPTPTHETRHAHDLAHAAGDRQPDAHHAHDQRLGGNQLPLRTRKGVPDRRRAAGGRTGAGAGNDPTANYWYIPNPDSPGEYCWVWGEYATISGFTGNVQMFTPPPTPPPTLTPTPSPGFGVSYEGLVGCSGSWWTRMEIENTGSLTFRSVEFVLIDQDAGHGGHG